VPIVETTVTGAAVEVGLSAAKAGTDVATDVEPSPIIDGRGAQGAVP
jgi:hypothetical protein